MYSTLVRKGETDKTKHFLKEHKDSFLFALRNTILGKVSFLSVWKQENRCLVHRSIRAAGPEGLASTTRHRREAVLSTPLLVAGHVQNLWIQHRWHMMGQISAEATFTVLVVVTPEEARLRLWRSGRDDAIADSAQASLLLNQTVSFPERDRPRRESICRQMGIHGVIQSCMIIHICTGQCMG